MANTAYKPIGTDTFSAENIRNSDEASPLRSERKVCQLDTKKTR